MDFLTLARNYQDHMIKDLQDLLAIASLSDEEHATEAAPFGPKIREALDWMLKHGENDGFDTLDVDGYAGLISYGQQSQSIGMLGHLDIVPVGEGWSVDPFGGEIKDGYIFGRGSGDDKGPTIAAYYAMKIIKDLGVELNKKIMLIVGCDEETGMRCMKHYIEHAPLPDMGFVPDAYFPVIYGEKGILNIRLLGEKKTVIKRMHSGERPNIVLGKCAVEVFGKPKEEELRLFTRSHRIKASYKYLADSTVYTFEGKYSHASTPQQGQNAAVYALNFVAAAYQDKAAADLSRLLYSYHGTGLNIEFDGAHMRNLTMNLGIIHIENNKFNLTLDIRYPNDVDFDFCITNINQTLTKDASWVKADVIAHKEPLFVDPNSDLVKTLHDVYRQVSGDDFTPLKTMGGGTYARTLPNFVAYGMAFPLRKLPEFAGDAHQKDEAIEIESLVMATAIYAKALYKLAYENAK
ncbi:MAG: dipeptidase PepV [Firmicutes bacterium HGW-Firmicutes-20]|nr:MAG: dipeptidase PepV [Firmicutes bacterium HGW-Firmicutes-20]PKM70059.1 MAG: dipeptidase PepV [Firmicutes bacterium HGW-Firmicutes-19]